MLNVADLKGLTDGEKLRAIRKSMGLTQQEFADKVNIERSAISKMESGTRTLSKWPLHVICKSLGVKKSIFSDTVSDESSPCNEEALMGLDNDEIETCVRQFAEFFDSASISSQFESFLVKMFSAYTATSDYAKLDIQEREI